MKNKTKKRLLICLACLIALTGSVSLTSYLSREDKYVDDAPSASNSMPEDTTIKEFTADKKLANNIYSDKYDESFNKKTYYVHSNDKRTILSQLEEVEGYELLGTYSSRSSADAVVYTIIDNGDGTVTYKVLSYDDLEKIGNRDAFDFYVFDQYTPDGLTASFIPDVSIVNDGYAKGLAK